MDGLLDKRLVIVTGKGGVGKSTVSLALALAGGARGQADDPLRGRRHRASLARLSPRRGRLPRGRDGREPVADLDRPRRVDARVRAAAAEGQGDARSPLPLADLHLPRGRHARAQGAGDDRQDLGAGARRPQGQAGPQLRPGDRRRPGDRSRGRLPADAAHLRQRRPGRADPPAGRDPRRVHPRPEADRGRGRLAARGDAGQRDRDARARPRLRGRPHGRPDLLQRALPRALRRRRGRAARRAGGRTRRRRAASPAARRSARAAARVLSASSSPGSRSSPRRR